MSTKPEGTVTQRLAVEATQQSTERSTGSDSASFRIHEPATALPRIQAGERVMAERRDHSEHVAKIDADNRDDIPYLVHSATAYPKLVEALR